jgi:hypothetical protein
MNGTVMTPQGAKYLGVFRRDVDPNASNLNFPEGAGGSEPVVGEDRYEGDGVHGVGVKRELRPRTGGPEPRVREVRHGWVVHDPHGSAGVTEVISNVAGYVNGSDGDRVGGVPVTGISGVVLNVTVVAGGSPGYLTVYPADVAAPLASNLNFSPGQVVPNLVAVKTSAAGAVAIRNASGSANHVIADVAGYFTA